MPRQPILLVVILAGSLSAVACRATPDYFPDYERCDFSMTVLLGGSILEGSISTRLEGTETIAGMKYEKWVSVASGFPTDPDVSFARRSHDGIFTRYPGWSEDQADTLSYPLPLEVGSEWSKVNEDLTQSECRAETIEPLYLVEETIDDALKIVCSRSGILGEAEVIEYLVPERGSVKTTIEMGGVRSEILMQKCK